MKRGEIWSGAETADYARKPRPWIVIQSDRFSGSESVLAVPLSSQGGEAPLLRLGIAPDAANGLLADSWAMVEKITAMRRTRLRDRIGKLSDDELAELEEMLLLAMGFAD